MGRAGALVLLVLAACGGEEGPAWAGTWTANYSSLWECGGNPPSWLAAGSTRYVVSEVGESLNFAGDDECGVMTARTLDGAASIARKTCMPVVQNGMTLTRTIVRGGATLKSETSMSASLEQEIAIEGVPRCSTVTDVVLTRVTQ